MMRARPTAAQERWLKLAARYPEYRQAQAVVSGAGDWRTVGFLTRCGLFVLGLIAAAAVCGLFFVMFARHTLIPAGLALCVAAEILMRRNRWFASGMEEILFIVGLTLLALGLLDAGHVFTVWSDEVTLAWVIAAAWLLAGLRMLNPLFTTVATLLASYALSALLRRGSYDAAVVHRADLWSGWFCCGVAVLALALGNRIWQRPSHDRMLDWLVVSMPVAAYLYLVSRSFTWRGWQQDVQPSWPAVIGLTGFAAAAVLAALRRRTHAPLFAAMGCCICLAYELRYLTGMPLYARLIIWGGLLLLASYTLERYLRTPRSGITSRPLADREEVFNVVEATSAAMSSPAGRASVAVPGTQPAVQGEGGRFGGGGASGGY